MFCSNLRFACLFSFTDKKGNAILIIILVSVAAFVFALIVALLCYLAYKDRRRKRKMAMLAEKCE